MNGDKSYAEQSAEYAKSAAGSAQRSAEKAQGAYNAALSCEQAVGKNEREIRDMRSDLTVGLTSVRDELRKLGDEVRKLKGDGPITHTHITDEDWTDSPTGTHVQVSKRTFDKWAREKEQSADAKKWRKVLSIGWKIAAGIALAVSGWLVRHYLGKP